MSHEVRRQGLSAPDEEPERGLYLLATDLLADPAVSPDAKAAVLDVIRPCCRSPPGTATTSSSVVRCTSFGTWSPQPTSRTGQRRPRCSGSRHGAVRSQSSIASAS